jgi:hypothetical protein
MARGIYIKRRCSAFFFLTTGRVRPRFRSLGLISPLIRKINRALRRIALLILRVFPSFPFYFFLFVWCGGGYNALYEEQQLDLLEIPEGPLIVALPVFPSVPRPG